MLALLVVCLLLACSALGKPDLPAHPFFPCEIPAYETPELIAQRHVLTPDVDPFIGSGGDGYGVAALPPGAQLPFGVCRVSPDTIYDDVRFAWRLPGGYSYCDNQIRAFSHTHLVGAGALDAGNIGVIPLLDFSAKRARCFNPTADGSDLRFCLFKQPFSHDSELAEPGGYNVVLNDPAGANASITVNLTATQHAAYHRYTYAPGHGLPYVVFDLCHSNSVGPGNCPNASVSLSFPGDGSAVVSGYMYNYGDFSGRFGGNAVWFYALLTGGAGALANQSGIWLANGTLLPQQTAADYQLGRDAHTLGAYVAFASAAQPVDMRLGISYIDLAGARSNLQLEITGDFAAVLASARAAWQQALAVVQVSSSSSSSSTATSQVERTKFYTALYHTMLAPTNWTEADGRYLGFDKQVHAGAGFDVMTDLSIWDVFRTEFPLLVLLRPDVAHNVVRSLMLMDEQLGGLPKWPLCNGDTGSMEGLFAVTMITDALLSATVSQDGINATAALAMSAASLRSREGPDWLSPGYLASASASLCYAVNDFCVAQLAASPRVPATADSQSLAAQFLNTSANWQHLWDSRVKFLCARDPATGAYTQCNKPAFVPLLSKRPMDAGYTEGDAWQYRWFVPQDMPRLVQLFGGSDRFVDALQHFFDAGTYTTSNFLPNAFFWAGNEPDIQTPYLFNYASPPRPDLTARWVRWTGAVHYTHYANGLSGNDDYGTMSAWFVWSALGLFPDNCRQRYFLGIPLFDSVVVQLAAGSPLKIVAHNNQPGYANVTVAQVLFNSNVLTSGSVEDEARTREKILHWFPGHMGKATKDIESRLDAVDVIIEVRDARIPLSSANPVLEEFAARKHRLLLLNKLDLAEPDSQAAFREHLLAHTRRDRGKNLHVLHVEATRLRHSRRLAERLVEQAAELVTAAARRPPALVSILVCGVPNVGKSTLINAFKARKVAATGRSPGITRSVGQAIPLDPPSPRPGSAAVAAARPPMFLIDTPGVMLPRIADPLVGLKLAAVDCIAAKQTDPEIVAAYIFAELLRRGAADAVYDAVKLPRPPVDERFSALLDRLARRTGADHPTAAEQFVRAFQRGNFGRFTLDQLP